MWCAMAQDVDEEGVGIMPERAQVTIKGAQPLRPCCPDPGAIVLEESPKRVASPRTPSPRRETPTRIQSAESVIDPTTPDDDVPRPPPLITESLRVQRGEWHGLRPEMPHPGVVRPSQPQRADSALSISEEENTADLPVPVAHPLDGHEKLMSCVRLLNTKSFFDLPKPLPRGQDLPDSYFGMPQPGGLVVSVSHAWRNQAHPDPTGQKMRALQKALLKVPQPAGEGKNFLFLDFVSIPQRPFQFGQAARTSEEMETFKAAIQCMHEMYFYSDHIVHMPWDDSAVEGEGAQRLVAASYLRDCKFLQIGDQVQVSAEGTPPQAGWAPAFSTRSSRVSFAGTIGSTFRTSSIQGVQAFDLVVAIGGETVTRVDQIEPLLDAGAEVAMLRRFPFGLTNPIPADSRGWVFLERFITMVKCAMMDEEQAKSVVITTSESILSQIMNGASQLRKAARSSHKSGDSGELKKALNFFLEELSQKKFSASSTDKREMDKKAEKMALSGDKEIVTGIMKEFVGHLENHWYEEAALQRSLASRARMVALAAKEYLTKWNAFSDEYALRLEEASERTTPWPFLAILFSPVVAVAMTTAPTKPPDQPWDEQYTWWFFLFPITMLIVLQVLPLYLFTVFQLVSFNTRTGLGLVAYLLAFFSVDLPISLFLSSVVFPVPLSVFIHVQIALSALPVFWFAVVPSELRASAEFRKKLFYCLSYYCMNAFLLGTFFPFLNSQLPFFSPIIQALLLCNYMLGKVLLELAAGKLTHIIGVDTIPCVVFHVTLSFEINVCISFLKVSNPLVVALQIIFNLAENAYHCWSLQRLSLSKREEQYLVCSLVIREFIELLTPLQFLGVFLAQRSLNPKQSALTCDLVGEEADRSLFFLMINVLAEVPPSIVTAIFLYQRGHAPFALLRGMMITRPFMWQVSIPIWLLYLCYTHSHTGNDLTLTFNWVSDPTVRWDCGYRFV